MQDELYCYRRERAKKQMCTGKNLNIFDNCGHETACSNLVNEITCKNMNMYRKLHGSRSINENRTRVWRNVYNTASA